MDRLLCDANMPRPSNQPPANIDLRVLPKTCYRASDRARPRWRFLLVAINRSRGAFVLRKVVIVQRSANKRRQRTVAGDALARALIQGSEDLDKGGAIVLDVQEPADTDIAAKSVTVKLEFSTRSGRKVACGRQVDLSPVKARYLRFPLRGTWLTANGRGNLHCAGTQFGFDFIHRDDLPLFEQTPKRRTPLREFATFGQPLYAPAAGEVVACVNDRRDRRAMLTASTFPNGLAEGQPRTVLLGNYVLLKLDADTWVLMAHVQRGSLRVASGDAVQEGALIGHVGNSGNTSGPHLHIEMLDGLPDFDRLATFSFAESGLPFGFRAMTVHQDQGKSRPFERLAPGRGDIVSSSANGH